MALEIARVGSLNLRGLGDRSISVRAARPDVRRKNWTPGNVRGSRRVRGFVINTRLMGRDRYDRSNNGTRLL